MSDPISRRLALKALGFASTFAGEAARKVAEAAMSTAAPTVGKPLMGMTNPLMLSGDPERHGPVGNAIQYLESIAYGIGVPATVEIRPSIAAFRSASPVVKAVWEQHARNTDHQRRQVAAAAIQLLRDGKIPL